MNLRQRDKEISMKRFAIAVAFDSARRERAFRLAFRVYRDCGYVVDTPAGRIVSKFDALPSTLVLLVQDAAGRDAATATLVFDSPTGLPSDEIRAADLAPLRAQGRRLVEVTRLAIDQDYKGSKPLLVQLFNAISLYARHEGSTDFVIEVHPRHVNYYRRLLMFEPAGPERDCPRANGAPGVLLRLDLAAQAAEIGLVGGSQGQARGRMAGPSIPISGRSTRNRSLQPSCVCNSSSSPRAERHRAPQRGRWNEHSRIC
jgi:N-acyl amino acid synthase FeeM